MAEPSSAQVCKSAPFSLAMGKESTPGVPSVGPYQTILQSDTSISWEPTFEPFLGELPDRCDWIVFGKPTDLSANLEKIERQWRQVDEASPALTRLLPESFVRSRVLADVCHDLATGASGRWDVSLDRLHGEIVRARFATDGPFEGRSFALPVLVPRVADLSWEDVSEIRRHRSIARLRDVLCEVEAEALEIAGTGGDLERALHLAYRNKVAQASEPVRLIRSTAATAAGELIVGATAGYLTMGLSLMGPIAGAAIAGTAMTALHVRDRVRERRASSWIGVMGTIEDAARRVP